MKLGSVGVIHVAKVRASLPALGFVERPESLKKLKRLGRYLLGNARMTTRYEWQGDES